MKEMAVYFISYDLRKGKDYQKMYDVLVTFNAIRVLESLWCFNRFNTTASDLRTYFKQFIDSDDGIVVVESKDWATFNAVGTPNDLK